MGRPPIESAEDIKAKVHGEEGDQPRSPERAARNIFSAPEAPPEQKDDQPVTPKVEPEEVPEVPSTLVPPKVYVKEFTDKSGRKTRIEAASEAELLDKVTAAYESASNAVVDYREKYRVFEEGKPLDFKAPVMSAEDKSRIFRKLQDPKTFDEGFSELQKFTVGESPEEYRQRRLNEAGQARIAEGQAQTRLFLDAHPDFPASKDTEEQMLKLMKDRQEEERTKRNDPKFAIGWTKHNLDLVYEDAVARGVITPKAVSPQETPKGEATPPVKAEQPSANPETPAEKTRPRGTRRTGLSPADSSVSATHSQQAGDEKFLEEVRKMPKDELKRRIKSDRKFSARLDAIYASQKA